MLFGKLIKGIVHKLGFTLVRGRLVEEIRAMEPQALSEQHLPNCKVYANRAAVLKTLPKHGRIAEVGVAYGDFSEVLLKELEPKEFIAIDLFSVLNKAEEPWGKNELSKTQKSHEDYYKDRFRDYEQVEIRKGYSWEQLAKFDDASFDYIYLDAGHKYPDVSRDIQALEPKLKVGGYVQFNDYTNFAASHLEVFGVAKAVNELLLKGAYEMQAFCLQTGGYHDVLLKKMR